MESPLNQKTNAPETLSNSQRIWVVSELYSPELTSTGYFLTGIAEGLAESCNVSVLCGQPSYWARGVRAPRHELLNGVDVVRCWATTLDKNNPLFRIINLITISLSVFLLALFRFRRGEIVIAVTNPPLLPYLASLACQLRGARFILLVHDVYPDILVRLGVFKPQSMFIGLLEAVSRWLYGSADHVFVIGRDMQALVSGKLKSNPERILVATNWANTDEVSPKSRGQNRLLASLNLQDRFVVQFWGNMGRPHCIEDLIDAAQMLLPDSGFHFLVIGWGTKRSWVINEKQKRGLENLTILDPLPREATCDVQNACDIAINTLASGMSGISVPSRSYNAMAAGKPLLAVCDSDSELAVMVREEDIGWVVPPGRPNLIVSALREAKADANRIRSMGNRARIAAETKYTRGYVLQVYERVIESLRPQ